MAQELLLEIGVEEIPSAYMPKTIEQLKNITAQKFKDVRLQYGNLNVWGTPRRLVLLVQKLEEKQPDAIVENRGPKKDIAVDKDGNPTKAGLGFARSQGVEFSDLQIRDVAGVDYIFAVKRETGSATETILPGLLTNIIESIGFPKSMRWGYHHTRFARPIRWLLALYGTQPIQISIENVISSNVTYGHRFLSSGPVKVNTIADYFQALKDNYVILDQDERREMIRQQVIKAAAAAGGVPADNPELLEEVTFLLEYPTAFYGEFSPSYLDVPPEVLTTTMINNQRYFPVFNDQKQLLPGFIGVRNGTDYRMDLVKAGNERVLKARLEDALFFWKEDNRKPLDDFVDGLKEVLFHEKLGSVYDKVMRLKNLAVFIGEQNRLSDPKTVSRAAYLCKADLLSSMVYEFTELQGTMGRYYAKNSGETEEVSEAIFEHYLPRFAGDILPSTPAGIVLSLAEKIDNLVGCFCIGIKPTGSQDPYALRRQALGVVNIILDKGLQLDLETIADHAYSGFLAIKPDFGRKDTVREVMEFIRQRLRGILLEKGIAYDVIDAVYSLAESDVRDLATRARVIQNCKEKEWFGDFMVAFNRTNNLSKKWPHDDVNEAILADESEKQLLSEYLKIKNQVNEALARQDYVSALEILAGLRPFIDRFFESVMIMVDDQELKAARLGLLKSITNLCNRVADFSKIVI
ncbi:MAG: glycine--tRNA ligase subunit beta [Syntrophomonadaceae bacterium]